MYMVYLIYLLYYFLFVFLTKFIVRYIFKISSFDLNSTTTLDEKYEVIKIGDIFCIQKKIPKRRLHILSFLNLFVPFLSFVVYEWDYDYVVEPDNILHTFVVPISGLTESDDINKIQKTLCSLDLKAIFDTEYDVYISGIQKEKSIRKILTELNN